MAGVKRRMYTDSDIHALHKELDEISCPICMDHPHNAVLLICSSHDKGCRSYICDTSYRHSNCLDRYKKLRTSSRNNTTLSHSSPSHPQHNKGPGENNIQQADRLLEREGEGNLNPEAGNSQTFHERTELEGLDVDNSSESILTLKCPMCRGAILGWEVVEEARKYLNLKRRTCSRESCSFVGNYQELRRHARRAHPTTRPSDIDPSRERAWRRLEHQREYSDIVSAIRSSMPGAVVVGDYVIENGDRFSAGRESGNGEVNAPWWTTFFLFHMIGSMDGTGESRARSRAWTRHRRTAGALSERRRFLWGENLLGLQDEEDDEEDDLHIFSDVGEDTSPIPRRRRRLTQSRSDEDQP
ncbi:plant/k7p8-3 protein [Citrus sinensis]|nr:plant/k7p8-3 protein [Citrus sinensis]